MLILETIKSTREALTGVSGRGLSVGFVPTMGALHEGHLELLGRARKENDYVVCSIFINPIQFDNVSDLEKYPRPLEHDLALLKQLGCDLVFVPGVQEMYPEKANKIYDFGQLDKVMEGKHRSGHFNGVAIVVSKLFEIIRPGKAYFGEKDYQQLAIIRRLVAMEHIPVEIVPCPTVREPDGLAMSSRNQRLSAAERLQAPFIYKTLREIPAKTGSLSIDEVVAFVEDRFRHQAAFDLEYFEIVDMDTLQPVKEWRDCPGIIACIAAFLGDVRLIDNKILFHNFVPFKDKP